MENNNRQVCRWVKASERLPEEEGTYYCKYDNEKYCLPFDGHDFLFAIGEPILNEEIEYLDESIEPCATSSEKAELGKGNFLSTMEAEYWRKRCEAAEMLLNRIGVEGENVEVDPSIEVEYNIRLKQWTKLKSQTPSPTGDRDCEELKKEVERLKGLLHGQAYSVWKGCSSDLTFEEWYKLYQNNL